MATVNVNPTSNTITVIDNGTQIVTVNTQGPQGPAGATGTSGSQGPSGSSAIPSGTVSGSAQITLLGFVTSSATSSFAITGSDVLFANITASGDISASGALVSGKLLLPSESTSPTGVYEGQIALVNKGGTHYIYVFVGGAWKSSSLA